MENNSQPEDSHAASDKAIEFSIRTKRSFISITQIENGIEQLLTKDTEDDKR
jgi:hypothetical protein